MCVSLVRVVCGIIVGVCVVRIIVVAKCLLTKLALLSAFRLAFHTTVYISFVYHTHTHNYVSFQLLLGLSLPLLPLLSVRLKSTAHSKQILITVALQYIMFHSFKVYIYIYIYILALLVIANLVKSVPKYNWGHLIIPRRCSL